MAVEPVVKPMPEISSSILTPDQTQSGATPDIGQSRTGVPLKPKEDPRRFPTDVDDAFSASSPDKEKIGAWRETQENIQKEKMERKMAARFGVDRTKLAAAEQELDAIVDAASGADAQAEAAGDQTVAPVDGSGVDAPSPSGGDEISGGAMQSSSDERKREKHGTGTAQAIGSQVSRIRKWMRGFKNNPYDASPQPDAAPVAPSADAGASVTGDPTALPIDVIGSNGAVGGELHETGAGVGDLTAEAENGNGVAHDALSATEVVTSGTSGYEAAGSGVVVPAPEAGVASDNGAWSSSADSNSGAPDGSKADASQQVAVESAAASVEATVDQNGHGAENLAAAGPGTEGLGVAAATLDTTDNGAGGVHEPAQAVVEPADHAVDEAPAPVEKFWDKPLPGQEKTTAETSEDDESYESQLGSYRNGFINSSREIEQAKKAGTEPNAGSQRVFDEVQKSVRILITEHAAAEIGMDVHTISPSERLPIHEEEYALLTQEATAELKRADSNPSYHYFILDLQKETAEAVHRAREIGRVTDESRLAKKSAAWGEESKRHESDKRTSEFYSGVQGREPARPEPGSTTPYVSRPDYVPPARSENPDVGEEAHRMRASEDATASYPKAADRKPSEKEYTQLLSELPVIAGSMDNDNTKRVKKGFSEPVTEDNKTVKKAKDSNRKLNLTVARWAMAGAAIGAAALGGARYVSLPDVQPNPSSTRTVDIAVGEDREDPVASIYQVGENEANAGAGGSEDNSSPEGAEQESYLTQITIENPNPTTGADYISQAMIDAGIFVDNPETGATAQEQAQAFFTNPILADRIIDENIDLFAENWHPDKLLAEGSYTKEQIEDISNRAAAGDAAAAQEQAKILGLVHPDQELNVLNHEAITILMNAVDEIRNLPMEMRERLIKEVAEIKGGAGEVKDTFERLKDNLLRAARATGEAQQEQGSSQDENPLTREQRAALAAGVGAVVGGVGGGIIGATKREEDRP